MLVAIEHIISASLQELAADSRARSWQAKEQTGSTTTPSASCLRTLRQKRCSETHRKSPLRSLSPSRPVSRGPLYAVILSYGQQAEIQLGTASIIPATTHWPLSNGRSTVPGTGTAASERNGSGFVSTVAGSRRFWLTLSRSTAPRNPQRSPALASRDRMSRSIGSDPLSTNPPDAAWEDRNFNLSGLCGLGGALQRYLSPAPLGSLEDRRGKETTLAQR
jgi:hypothetical protein